MWEVLYIIWTILVLLTSIWKLKAVYIVKSIYSHINNRIFKLKSYEILVKFAYRLWIRALKTNFQIACFYLEFYSAVKDKLISTVNGNPVHKLFSFSKLCSCLVYRVQKAMHNLIQKIKFQKIRSFLSQTFLVLKESSKLNSTKNLYQNSRGGDRISIYSKSSQLYQVHLEVLLIIFFDILM